MKLKSILLLSATVLAFGNSFAQSMVNTNGKKYVLLEEATGTWCGYCPDGAQNIQETIERDFPRCISASFHGPTGYGEPMMITGDPFCTGGNFSTSFPYGCVDRNVFAGKQGLSRAWDSYVKTDTALAPKFDVVMKSAWDVATAKLTIELTAKCLVAGTGVWSVNAYILEDSIPSSGANIQHSYAGAPHTGNYYDVSCTGSAPWYLPYPSGGSLPASMYAHMNVVRAVLAKAVVPIWGDTALTNPTVGQTFTKTYTYTIPTTQNAWSMKVIGLVQKYGAVKTDRPIENAIMAKVRLMKGNVVLGTNTPMNVLQDLTVFPNPTSNFITVKCSLDNTEANSITIMNVAGQIVMHKEYAGSGTLFAEKIALSDLSSGTYFLQFTNNGATETRQFVINK
ncbi:MAG: outer membrane protein Omp28 [Flavipsychrobacter sp.]|nr:outer membrane protein Omp28 [Flavipsychrobacter sp.]